MQFNDLNRYLRDAVATQGQFRDKSVQLTTISAPYRRAELVLHAPSERFRCRVHAGKVLELRKLWVHGIQFAEGQGSISHEPAQATPVAHAGEGRHCHVYLPGEVRLRTACRARCLSPGCAHSRYDCSAVVRMRSRSVFHALCSTELRALMSLSIKPLACASVLASSSAGPEVRFSCKGRRKGFAVSGFRRTRSRRRKSCRKCDRC
jgi:hypothetical protein